MSALQPCTRRPNEELSLSQRPPSSSSSYHPRPSSPSSSPALPPPTSPYDPKIDLRTHSLLILFSFLGCLVRLGLNALFAYPAQAVFPLVWAQGVGCLIMGLCVGRKREIEEWGGKALYAALATGLCGSITTFSSWMLQTFEQFSNLEHVSGRTGVHDTLAGLTHLIFTLFFSLFSFHLGRHLSRSTSLPFHRLPPIHSNSLFRLSTLVIPPLLYLALLLLAILASSRTDRALLLTLILAPPGTLLRYHLGLILNPILSAPPPPQPSTDDGEEEVLKSPRSTRSRVRRTLAPLPLGTLAANLLATIILSLAFLLQRTPSVVLHTTQVGCMVEQAFEDGFCGSLSTVSTFVAELDGMKSGWRRVIYVGTSVVLGLVCVLAVVGGGWWSGEGLGEGCKV